VTSTQIQFQRRINVFKVIVYNDQQILVVAFEFTGAARDFMINLLCDPRLAAGSKRLDSIAIGLVN